MTPEQLPFDPHNYENGEDYAMCRRCGVLVGSKRIHDPVCPGATAQEPDRCLKHGEPHGFFVLVDPKDTEGAGGLNSYGCPACAREAFGVQAVLTEIAK
jgi:hypothetical protein